MNEQIKRAAAPRKLFDGGLPRSQQDTVRDVLLAAASCETWLTLEELGNITHYREASISAVLRALKAAGFTLTKRRRDKALKDPALDGRGQVVWEYTLTCHRSPVTNNESQKERA